MANFDRLLAEHIRETLAAATFSETVVVERKYRPKRQAKDLDEPVITVAAGLQNREVNASRLHSAREHTIRVGIQCKLKQEAGQVSDARCDELADLTESVMDLIEAQVSQYESATITTINTEPMYDPEQMDNPGIWQGAITAVYRRIARGRSRS